MVIASVLTTWNWVSSKSRLTTNKIRECRDEYTATTFHYTRTNPGSLPGALSYNKGLGFRVLGTLIFDTKINPQMVSANANFRVVTDVFYRIVIISCTANLTRQLEKCAAKCHEQNRLQRSPIWILTSWTFIVNLSPNRFTITQTIICSRYEKHAIEGCVIAR